MSKVKTFAILGVGYVLGAQAGRQRYEQMKRQALRLAEHPRTRQLTQQARDGVSAKLPPVVASGLQRVTGRQGRSDPAPADPAPAGNPPAAGAPTGHTVEVPPTDAVEPATPPSQL
jgi:hypothetical protein